MYIVYVEDDEKQRGQITRYLTSQGNRVAAFATAAQALTHLSDEEPDAFLCDYMLNDKPEGIWLSEQVRKLYPRCGIVVITQHGETKVAVSSFLRGADNFIEKPVLPNEILNCLRGAVDHRRTIAGSPITNSAQRGALTLNREQHIASWSGEALDLTPTEFDLLARLVAVPGNVSSPGDLCAFLWGEALEGSNASDRIKPHIYKLRAKLDAAGAGAIRNDWGKGYYWSLGSSADE